VRGKPTGVPDQETDLRCIMEFRICPEVGNHGFRCFFLRIVAANECYKRLGADIMIKVVEEQAALAQFQIKDIGRGI